MSVMIIWYIFRTYFRPMDDYGRGETAADGYGVTLWDEKGNRTGLKAVELRFKRLDWGMWIRLVSIPCASHCFLILPGTYLAGYPANNYAGYWISG